MKAINRNNVDPLTRSAGQAIGPVTGHVTGHMALRSPGVRHCRVADLWSSQHASGFPYGADNEVLLPEL